MFRKLAMLVLMPALCARADAGRTDYVAADLSRRTAPVAWTWTEATDHSVRFAVSRNGEDFPTAGWGGTLFMGDGALGCAVAGASHGYNELLFDVERGNVPTNGKYAVQIIATNAAGRVEEWGRGTLTVRANPAAEGMPTNWSAYADIARKVAPYIDAEGILSDTANADALWGAVSNRTDALIQAVAPAPDFTTNNVELVETIEEAAPKPGDYETVSNKASTISLPGDDGHPGGLCVPYFDGRAREAEGAYDLKHNPQDPNPGALALGKRGQIGDGGAEYGVWWPRFLDAWNGWHWVAGEDHVASAVAAAAAASTNHADEAVAAATNGVFKVDHNSGVGTLLDWGYLYRLGIAWEAWNVLWRLPADPDEESKFVDEMTKEINIASTNYVDRKVAAVSEAVTAAASASTNYTDEAIAAIDIPDPDLSAYATTQSVAAVAAIVDTWEGYWGGTNVLFEVTNYYGNTSGEIPRLRIKELMAGGEYAGTYRTVWDEASKFHVCETNILAAVAASNSACRAACAADLSDGLASRAPLAWGAVTDKGATNVVGNSVWMTSPETYFGGGTEYQRVAVGSGTICVLADNGAGAYTAGEAGTFRFQDDGGTNYFGFAQSDSYTIGCNTDGITVSGNLVTLRYDVIMGGTDVPIVYRRPSLSDGSWAQLNNADGTAADGAAYTVTWYTSGGSYYAAINCGDNASGFFKAETSVAGDVVFETNMKARLGGGIECENTATGVMGVIRPTYNGSGVTWTWSAR